MSRFKILRLYKRAQRGWPTFWRVTLGSALYASSLALFVLPARFPDSGIAGIAVLVKYVWDIPPGPVLLLMNMALFAYAWKALSRRFLSWTVWAVVVFTATLQILEGVNMPVIEDRFLVVVAAAALRGGAWAMVISGGGSLGGTDIVATALYRTRGVEIGKFTFWFHALVVAVSLPVVGYENLLYGAALLYLSCLIFDSATRSFDRRKQVLVVSAAAENVRNYITRQLRQGVTMLDGAGGYTGARREILLAMLLPRQVADLKRYLRSTDPRAFVVLYEASEVFGRRFKSLDRESIKPRIGTRSESQRQSLEKKRKKQMREKTL
ncbi:MAG: YitT family protein [Synergistota bacterium]|nr:YitT family protein [Synergistota bacterium]